MKSFGDLTFFVQNHENNNKQKMFLRDFPLSIPERDFLKKEPMLFFTNKNPLKNKESHSFAWQNYTRKLTAGYPKLWVGQGDSFETWPFFGMLNLWQLRFFPISGIGVAVFDQRNLTIKKKYKAENGKKKTLKMDSVTENGQKNGPS